MAQLREVGIHLTYRAILIARGTAEDILEHARHQIFTQHTSNLYTSGDADKRQEVLMDGLEPVPNGKCAPPHFHYPVDSSQLDLSLS
jgi:hypothetical protein